MNRTNTAPAGTGRTHSTRSCLAIAALLLLMAGAASAETTTYGDGWRQVCYDDGRCAKTYGMTTYQAYNGSYVPAPYSEVRVIANNSVEIDWLGGRLWSIWDGTYAYDRIEDPDTGSVKSYWDFWHVESYKTTGQPAWQEEIPVSNTFVKIDNSTLKRMMTLDSGGKFNITYHVQGNKLKADLELTAGYNRKYRFVHRTDTIPSNFSLNNQSKKFDAGFFNGLLLYDWSDVQPYTTDENGTYVGGYNTTQWVDNNAHKFYQQIEGVKRLNVSEKWIVDPSWQIGGSSGNAWSGNSSFENTTLFRDDLYSLNSSNDIDNVIISNINNNGTYGPFNYLTSTPYGNNKSAYRIYARKNLTVDNIYTYRSLTGTPNNAIIELQYDDGTVNHFPNGTVIGTYNRTQGVGWDTGVLSTSANLVEGNYYHIVIYNSSWTSSNYQRIFFNSYTDDVYNEKMEYYDGSSWNLENGGNLRQSIFFVSNNTCNCGWGTPYNTEEYSSGDRYTSERVTFNEPITIYEVAFQGRSASAVGNLAINITYTNGTEIAVSDLGYNYVFPSDGYAVAAFNPPVTLIAGTYDFRLTKYNMSSGTYRPYYQVYPVQQLSFDSASGIMNDNGNLRSNLWDMYFWINRNITTGNLTTWHDAGADNETYQIDVNATGNYSVSYNNNDSGMPNVELGNFTAASFDTWNNQSITIAPNTKYQDTIINTTLFGNITATSTLYAITFFTQAASAGGEPSGAIPPDPVNLANTTGNFYVNHTWAAGVGNVTNSFNVSQNGTWTNGSANTYYNASVGAHGWSNITVFAFNSSGNGNLSTGSASMNTQIPNNAITISNINDAYTLTEGQTLNIDANYADADSDTGTFDRNFTKGTFNTGTGVLAWTTVDGDQGTYNWLINVSDGYGSVATKTFTVTVGDSTPGTPADLTPSTSNFWANYTWSAGANTDSFNVSYNGTWTNGSAVTAIQGEVGAHGWGNISVAGYNATLSALSSAVTANTQVPNNVPVQAAIGSKTVDENQWLNFTISTTDADSDSITYQTNATKGTLTTNSYSWKPTYTDSGTYLWEFNSSDGYGGIDTETITVTVTNIPLSATSSLPASDPTTTQGTAQEFNLTLNRTANVTWYMNGTQVQFNESVTIANYTNSTAGVLASWNVTASATDGIDSTSRMWNWTINAVAPETYIPPTPVSCSASTENFWINTSCSAGTGNITNGMNFTNGTVWVNGTSFFANRTLLPHAWSNESVYAFNSSSTGTLNQTPATLNTQIPNNVPVMNAIGNKNVNEGALLSFSVTGSDADSDPITCSTNATKGTLTDCDYSWTPDYTESGTYDFIYYYNDSYGGSDSESITITVNDVPQPSMPPTPINLANTTGNFWINHTWSAGTGNITNSYNVSVNGTWTNGTTDLFKNTSTSAHGWANISVYAYNSTGSGLLNQTPVSQNTQVPNNAITISGISDTYTMNAGNTLSIDAGYTDADSDTGTFDRNFTKGTFNTGTGVLSWTTGVGDIGTYNWLINVTDGYGSTATKTFTVDIVDTGGTGTDWDWLDGFVLDTEGAAVNSATITTSAGITTTNSTGYYSFGYLFVHGDAYWINVTKTGYNSNNTQITFTSDHQVHNATLTLTPAVMAPNITSWGNSNTSNSSLTFTVARNTNITFNITANQSVTTTWAGTASPTKINGTGATDSYAFKNFTSIGTYTVIASCSNDNGSCTNGKTWTVTVTGIGGITVEGYVQNVLELKLENARVDFNGSFVYTDAAGYYSIGNVTEGDYTVLARQIGYRNASNTTTINTDTVVNFTLRERTSGTVSAPGFNITATVFILAILWYIRRSRR